MKVCIVYIFPQSGANGHLEKAVKFLTSYHANPPMHLHDTVIVCNEAPANDQTRFLFGSLPSASCLDHDGSGMDCGAYQLAAQKVPCDLMVFFGGNTYFRRPGWLHRMASVFQSYGDGLYGCTGNQGDARFNVFPHVRTTAFFCSPALVNEHPLRVTNNSQRYPYEHGPDGLTTWALRKGKPVWIVGWNDVKPLHDCDSMRGGFHQGGQENVLVGDRLTCPPYYHCE